VEPVAELVAGLESRGVRFFADGIGVRFECKDSGALLPTDPARLGELVLERPEETLRFLTSRARPSSFGLYAGEFRALTHRICNPPGMLPWLRERYPGIYAELDRQADRVCELWKEGAPSEEFSLSLRLLEEKHAAAKGFYEACQKGNEDGQG
jgi:hypothetical protein